MDPPKVEDRIGAVPHGLSTDSDVAKRYVTMNEIGDIYEHMLICS